MKRKTLLNNIFILKYLWRFKKSYIFITLIPTSLGILTPTIDILLMKYIIDGIVNNIEFSKILMFVIFACILGVISALIDAYFSNLYYPINEEYLRKKMHLVILDKMKEYEISFYDNPTFYNDFILAANEAKDRPVKVWMTVCSMVKNILTIGTLATIMAFIDPLIMVFSVIAVIFDISFKVLFNKRSYRYAIEKQPVEREKAYIDRVFCLPQYAKEMKLTRVRDVFQNKYKNASSRLSEIISRNGKKITWLDGLGSVVSILITSSIMAYLAYNIFHGSLTIGSFSVMLTATLTLRGMLSNVIRTFPEFFQHGLFIENLKRFLSYKPQINENLESTSLDTMSDSIELQNVMFEYEKGNVILNDISLTVHKGEKIAIVGHNGAGKTTLIKLLLRFYDPTQGTISMDKFDYHQLNVKDLRRKFSVVFQDYQYYSLTVAENVLMRECLNEDDRHTVIESLQKSGLYDKIRMLPKGIDAVLTKEFDEHGVILSGGETQKLALARVFARDSEIIILDEPSSSLDPLAEHEMHKNMLEAQAEKTVIIISHRLSTTISADTICYMENGEIIEKGDHKDLMNLNGKYANMFMIQAKNYIQQ